MTKSRTRNRPMDPAEAARLAFEHRTRQGDPSRWGIDAEALRLPSNENVDTRLDVARRVARAQRFDVFSLLFFRPGAKLSSNSYDAVRRLQKDLAILHATQGASDQIRTASAPASPITADFSLRRVTAGEAIKAALDGMTPWRARLIRELCETEVVRGQTPNWHDIVRRQTGELDRMRRGTMVRESCDDLAASYRALDNRPGRAVA